MGKVGIEISLLGRETKWREHPLNKSMKNLEIEDRHLGEGQDRETYGLRDCEWCGMKKLVMCKYLRVISFYLPLLSWGSLEKQNGKFRVSHGNGRSRNKIYSKYWTHLKL